MTADAPRPAPPRGAGGPGAPAPEIRSALELLQGLDAIVWEADPGTFRFRFVSDRAEAILGYPVRRWLEEPDFWVAHLHPEDRDRVVEACRAATEAGRDHALEYRMVARDGRSGTPSGSSRTARGAPWRSAA